MRLLDYEDFERIICNEIRNYLPEEYRNAVVSTTTMEKLGSTYTALTVVPKKGMACPAVNMDLFYNDYLAGRSELSEILPQIASVIEDNKYEVNIDWIKDYERVKKKLFIRVSNPEQNEELLKKVPHEIDGDFAITCHIQVRNDNGCLQSTIISNDMMKMYDITEEQLIHDAKENGKRLFPMTYRSIQQVIESFTHEKSAEDDHIKMMVVSNEMNVNGAAAFFYPDSMEKIGKLIGGDYYVIPSSIHEVMIVPADEGNPAKLKDILHFVNDTQVDPSEQLGSEIYMYDTNAHEMRKAEYMTVDLEQSFTTPAFLM